MSTRRPAASAEGVVAQHHVRRQRPGEAQHRLARDGHAVVALGGRGGELGDIQRRVVAHQRVGPGEQLGHVVAAVAVGVQRGGAGELLDAEEARLRRRGHLNGPARPMATGVWMAVTASPCNRR
ncbi:MAG: hypothetical protein IPM17_09995 [Verrucomicrobia bacterium]|nr:hypothetical protein [Verrucomicrobiota bacterium]